jgi:DNA repair exonuclease SbcCD ATPase subunit
MEIMKLKIKNFLTIGEAEMNLDSRGLLLIQGVNNDDTSAGSNGAGKSSIPDALCWGIYGVTARGVASDAVVSKVAKKNCAVTVQIQDGDNFYEIRRYRKDATNKNAVFVTVEDKGGRLTDMSKGTDRETQEVINQIMGCSLDVFMSAVYAGQEKMPDLPGMTDKQLKLLIEEAAGIEVLTGAYSIARERYNAAKVELDGIATANMLAMSTKVRLCDELDGFEAQSKAFEDGRRVRAKAELGGVPAINAEIATAEMALRTWDKKATEEELDECKVKLDAHGSERAELDRLNQVARKTEQESTRLRTQLEVGKRDLITSEKMLAEIDDHVGKPCGECGKAYHAEDLEVARVARIDAINKQKSELLPIVKAYKGGALAVATAFDVARKFQATMTDVTVVAQRQRELSNLVNAIDATNRDIEVKQKRIDALKTAASLKLTETNPWTKAIESKQAEITRNGSVIAASQKLIEEKSANAEMLADAVKVFGPAGVRAHILDTVTPYLNERTSDYLGALTDGNIHAVWSTLSTTAKGDLKEKFNIEVENDKGAESFAGLSGGEKRKVRLASAMALQDMVASRATKPINIFIADEVDHALDEPGLERLMGILDKKAKERGTVLVISHNSLSDWIDDVVTVTKTSGVSAVSGMTGYGR